MRKRETPITAAEITAAVAETYGLSETDLLRRGNREPKDLWIRLLYEESGLSQREIGLLAGHCDGSTVSRSLARIASTMAEVLPTKLIASPVPKLRLYKNGGIPRL